MSRHGGGKEVKGRCRTHSKGDGGHHDLHISFAPVVLHLHPLLWSHARMVAMCSNVTLLLHKTCSIFQTVQPKVSTEDATALQEQTVGHTPALQCTPSGMPQPCWYYPGISRTQCRWHPCLGLYTIIYIHFQSFLMTWQTRFWAIFCFQVSCTIGNKCEAADSTSTTLPGRTVCSLT